MKRQESGDLLDCYSSLAHEETVLFNRKEAWNNEDALDEKYLEYLMPASKPYFSRLRPLFSFQVKSLSSLNNFSHVLFRDGIVFLLRFFQRFSKPEGLRCRVLIHQDFEQLVPVAWKSHIYYYKTIKTLNKENAVKKVILNLSLDSYPDQEVLRIEMDQLKRSYPNKTNFLILSSFNILRGEDFINYCRHSALSSLLMAQRELGGDLCELLTLEEFWSMDFSEVELYRGKGERVFMMDSFLEHHILAKGGSVHGIEAGDKERESFDLSPHHGMSVEKKGSLGKGSAREFLFEKLSFPDSDLFQSEPADVRGLDDYFKVFYYSQDILKVARQINHLLVS